MAFRRKLSDLLLNKTNINIFLKPTSKKLRETPNSVLVLCISMFTCRILLCELYLCHIVNIFLFKMSCYIWSYVLCRLSDMLLIYCSCSQIRINVSVCELQLFVYNMLEIVWWSRFQVHY